MIQMLRDLLIISYKLTKSTQFHCYNSQTRDNECGRLPVRNNYAGKRVSTLVSVSLIEDRLDDSTKKINSVDSWYLS